MKTTLFILLCGIGIAGCNKQNDTTQTSSPPESNAPAAVSASPTTQPDNTGINARDRDPGAVTAGTQGQSKSDVDMTAAIRRQIMSAKMSLAAQNAKVICQGGKVTLRGPVNSQDEKDSIGDIANNVAGASNVDNELEIKPNG
jgi:hyperosmotically inducible periplasmic protein